MKRVLVVLSGGQDSTTCLAWAKRQFDEVHAITFDYGQRHHAEIIAANMVAGMLGVASHEVIHVPNILTGRSFLTDHAAPVEEFGDFAAMEHHNAFKQNKLDSSFVPMRNAMFLTIAANRAYVLEADTIVTGVTAADFAEYAAFNWQWLGGYLDACGTVKDDWIVCKNDDPEFCRRLATWIKTELPDAAITSDGKTVMLRRDPEVVNKLVHNLHDRPKEHRSSAIPMSSSYVAGFWEGCGKVYATFGPCGKDASIGPKMALTFKHENADILYQIDALMGESELVYPEDGVHKLLVPINKQIVEPFQRNLCSLASFEKLTIARQSLGDLAGGFNPPYPDCSPDFIYTFNKQLDEALRVPGVKVPKVIAPLMFLSKAQSVLLAKDLPGCMDALAYSHTSYDGQYPPTGRNHANLLRAKGFEDAGVADPLVVRAWREGLMELPLTPNYAEYGPF